jgi:PKD repeat protein
MKKSFLLLIVSFLFSCVFSQQLTLSGSYHPNGFTLQNESRNQVQILFSLNEIILEDLNFDGESMKQMMVPGSFLPNNAGAPDLPGFGRYIAVPAGSKPLMNVLSYKTQLIENIALAPAPEIPFDSQDQTLTYQKDGKIYNRNAFYPEMPFQLSEKTSIRGVDAVMLGITPFQYNPVTQQLRVFYDIELEIIFEGGGHIGDDRLRSRWFDPILQDALLNYQSLPEVDFDQTIKEASARNGNGYEYLIVVPNNTAWLPYAEQIKDWRTKQGIKTGIVTLDDIGGSTVAALENYFNNAYNNWDIPPVAVLLMADYGTNASNSIVSPIWDGYCVSDNIFADVTGNNMPDIIFARMTAQNTTHLQTMVSKMLNYESNPPMDFNFYHQPITALGWQTERWFQICSETIGGYWREVEGKEPVRINEIYDGTPGATWSTATNTNTVVNYFGPNGLGYIPASPSTLGGWAGGTPSQIINAINSGAFALQHRDHGYEYGWGEPEFSNTHINSLTNNQNNELPFIFSINCLTGKYNISGECFTEKFHRHTYNGQNAGALGLIAASEVSYSFVNDTYVWGMFDNMNPDFMPAYGPMVEERGFLPAFGNAAGKYFLQQSNWPYNTSNKLVTYHLFHHHGGAFLQVYSEVPQTLTVAHSNVIPSGQTEFTITANAGSFIALTIDDVILATAEGTGAPVSLTIQPQMPPATLTVTVTKQNYLRYEQTVSVISPEGPYVVFDEYEIFDILENSGNGQVDYGETIFLALTLKNVGTQSANNVTANVSTTDAYIEMLTTNQFFGNIPAGASVTIQNACSFNVSSEIPDQHSITFLLTANDNASGVWQSNFGIVANAPDLIFDALIVDDSGGNNNGILDQGETANVQVMIRNSGGSSASGATGILDTSDPYLTIHTVNPQSFGSIPAGQTASAAFSISAAATVPEGYTALADLIITDNLGVVSNVTISFDFKDYCYPTANCSYGDGFTGFSLGNINNMNSGCSPSGYGDFTAMTTDLEAGQIYSLQWKTGYSNQFASLWIDLNSDREFQENERLITDFSLSSANTVYTTTFTVPETATPGVKRLRIRANWQNSASDPCSNYSYGETEDYTVVIAGAFNPPQNLMALVEDHDVVLTWDAPVSKNLIGYNVYRNGGLIAQEIQPLTYTDSDLPGGDYNFTVTAVYSAGMSAPTAPVIVQVGAPEIAVIPLDFHFELFQGDETTESAVIKNNGDYPLQYLVYVEYPDKNVTDEWLTIQGNAAGTINPTGYETVNLEISAANLIPGNYYAEIIIANNDPDNSIFTIPAYLIVKEIIPLVADFSADPTAGNLPLNVQFTNLSTGNPIVFEWDFDNDGIIDSNIENPEWEYTLPGVYSVRLTVRNADDESDFILNENFITVTNPPAYFETVWSSPFNPMSIYVLEALADDFPLQAGDEIGIFDIDPISGNLICVGAGQLTGEININNYLEIIASMDDGSNPDGANGFTQGNDFIFKFYSQSDGEIGSIAVEFPYPGYDEVFTSQGSAFVELLAITQYFQTIPLQAGWNIMSLMVDPLNKDMLEVIDPLINQNALFKVLDENGGSVFHLPFPEPNGQWTNTIGDVACTEGYYIKVHETCTLPASGALAPLPFDIPLFQGWNMMGYPSPESADAMWIIQPLIDAGILSKVVDESGGSIFHLPFPPPNGQWHNTIGNFHCGKGYYIMVDDNATLTINLQPNPPDDYIKNDAPLNYFQPDFSNNPYMPMHVAIKLSDDLNIGDEIAIFDGDICTGAVVYTGETSGFAVIACSADDPDTQVSDGFSTGNNIEIKIWDHQNQMVYNDIEIDFISGNEFFTPLGTSIYSISKTTTGFTVTSNESFSIQIIPNPAKDKTSVHFSILKESFVEFEILNLYGHKLKQLAGTKMNVGNHQIEIITADLPSGYYQLKYKIENHQYSNQGLEKFIVINH